jgi:hypothetical protein
VPAGREPEGARGFSAVLGFDVDPSGDADDTVWAQDPAGYGWDLEFDRVTTDAAGTISFALTLRAVSYEYGAIYTYEGELNVPLGWP